MKQLTAFIFCLCALVSFSQSYNLGWASGAGGSSFDAGTSTVVDAAGNIYTTGYFNGTVDFNPGTGVFNLTSAGDYDAFVSKLDANGNFVWAVRFGAASQDIGQEIILGPSGDLLISGVFRGTVDFNPGAGTFNLSSAGAGDAFVLKLSSSGTFIWAVKFGGTSSENAWSIVTDALGNSYTVGIFQGTADFDPGAGVFNLTSNGLTDAFVVKLDAAGTFVWAKSFGDFSGDDGNCIALDPTGNILIGGSFRGTVDFDPGPGTENLTAVTTTASDGFLLKLDGGGNFIWAKQIGGNSADFVSSITTDNSGNVFYCGYFNSTADFDPGVANFDLTSNGSGDVFVSRLDSAGNFVWAKSFGGTSTEEVIHISVTPFNTVQVSGYFQNTVDFDPGLGTTSFASAGSYDAYLAEFSLSGNFIAVNTFGGTSDEAFAEFDYDNAGNIILTGFYGGTVDFNPGSGIFNLGGNGQNDILWLKLIRVCPSSSSTISVSDCSSYTVPSGHETYTVSGTYTDTIPNAAGCDSVITINLTISDGIAPVANVSSLPDVTAQCSVTALTAPTATDNCAGTITGTHNATLPITTPGTTVVTWTYNDGHGNTSTQTQNVIINDNTAPVANAANLADITEQCSVTALTAPTATDNCAGTITGTHNATLPITTSGTTVVTWTYSDGNGNTFTQTQNVIINDNTAPVANAANLADVTAQCSVTALTAPTATDNCAGTITGTHNATLPITTSGTTVVTWTYNDGHGNTSTQTQNVIINDNTAPVANTANLADVIAQCSVTSLTAPTATDNCAGTITGTHNATLPITTPGTTVVTWTYNDGHGNTSTQTQNVIITLPVATTTLNGITISATTSGATYQWINCGAGNTPIAGATSQSYTATANGTYAVIVTQNGCSATSACMTISTVGLEDLTKNFIAVYPNPNTGHFKVVIETPALIVISNAAGQEILTQALQAGENTIELMDVESGVYFITATSNGNAIVQRINIVH